MIRDHSLPLRRAVVTKLNSLAPVTSIVSSRIYGEKAPANPTWPFVRCGFIQTSPRRSECWPGGIARFDVHAFARGADASNGYLLAKEIAEGLDDSSLTFSLGGSPPASGWCEPIDWLGTIPLRDTEEADDYHFVIQFSTVTGEDA